MRVIRTSGSVGPSGVEPRRRPGRFPGCQKAGALFRSMLAVLPPPDRIDVASGVRSINGCTCARKQVQLDLQQVAVYPSVIEKGRSIEATNKCTTPGNML